MAAVDVIYLLAALLWIGAALTALCIGCLVIVKFRARRRRINRLVAALRMPASMLAEALDIPRKRVARGSQRRPHRW